MSADADDTLKDLDAELAAIMGESGPGCEPTHSGRKIPHEATFEYVKEIGDKFPDDPVAMVSEVLRDAKAKGHHVAIIRLPCIDGSHYPPQVMGFGSNLMELWAMIRLANEDITAAVMKDPRVRVRMETLSDQPKPPEDDDKKKEGDA